jgi:hypothetical protein
MIARRTFAVRCRSAEALLCLSAVVVCFWLLAELSGAVWATSLEEIGAPRHKSTAVAHANILVRGDFIGAFS